MDQSLLPNILSFLSDTDPFDKLPADARCQLAASVDISYLAKGERLDGERIVGAGLYMVRVGAVEQRHHDLSLRARLASGDLFGFSQLKRDCDCEYTVCALENTLLYLIPQAVLNLLMAENPAVRDHFAGKEGQRLAGTQSRDQKAGDNTLYLKSVAGVLHPNVAIVEPTATIQQAAGEMVRQHRSNALVMDGEVLLGIITDRDMTKRVIAQGRDFTDPVTTVMTDAPCTIDADAPLVRAVELMMQQNVRSLPVVEGGKIKGVLTATSMIEKSRVQAVYLISRIYRQESVAELKALSLQRQSVFETLTETGVHPRSIQQMMSLIADAFNKRLLLLAERKFGPPPCDYAWIVAGSQARNEVHYLSDQDNGLILACEPDERQKDYFRRLTEYVCSGLAECGYPLCSGYMMATNPKWCVSHETWLSYYCRWVMQPEAEALLNISVFLDTRFLYGNEALFRRQQQRVSEYTKGNRRFLAVLVANSLRISPPLGMFRQFVLAKDGENGSVFNIKTQALNLLVELARIYALAANSSETETSARLKAAVEAQVISDSSRKELLEAFHFINQVRFNHQRSALIEGKAASNKIAPALLTQFERNHLKDAFRIIARTQEAALLRYNAKGVIT
ncbi:DUF294 nucleotidyltransferase-like domain-containing protein [Photobacterium chitinilyticum]|uniref:Cyclic nucleotide-binding/CBS domain-containing protein n=1 Tax=Photobacterium chitinilyticum TaxID=2485123 RepID=A0A444JT38_9GAMM|nr:DUF294 nucleotidyltransferase-like domain-containing protein [Photobacterium chitinilyticum]RWX56264.1 cyclic nucleotide-binding/CBS domain-containing protein [Photobacterium chitinilyticum]